MSIFFPGSREFGPIAFNATGAAPTAMYIYPERFKQYVGKERLWGFDKAGTVTDGAITDAIQAMTTDPDMSTASLGYDNDDDSPYKGDLRLTITMA